MRSLLGYFDRDFVPHKSVRHLRFALSVWKARPLFRVALRMGYPWLLSSAAERMIWEGVWADHHIDRRM